MKNDVRENLNLALAVRYGIILDLELGAVSAWTFMANNGVSSSIIMRVLLNKEQRRAADDAVLNIIERYRTVLPQRETIHTASPLSPCRMFAE